MWNLKGSFLGLVPDRALEKVLHRWHTAALMCVMQSHIRGVSANELLFQATGQQTCVHRIHTGDFVEFPSHSVCR